MRLLLLALLLATLSGCAAPAYQTVEQRREAKERWERFTEEEDDLY